MFIATLSFSLLSILVKYLSHIPAHELVFFRAVISLVITSTQIRYLGISPWQEEQKMLVLRGVFGTIALITFFISIQKIPLGTSAILAYSTPIFTTIIGIFYLKEKVNKMQWLAFFISFLGVFIVKGFDKNLPILYFLLGVVSALSSAIVYNLIRKIRKAVHPLVIVFYFPLVALPFMGIWTFFDGIMPQGWDWFWIVCIGLLTQLGQICMTMSLQSTSVAKSTTVQFLGVINGLLFSIFFFKEKYDIWAIGGILLIGIGVISGLYAAKKDEHATT